MASWYLGAGCVLRRSQGKTSIEKQLIRRKSDGTEPKCALRVACIVEESGASPQHSLMSLAPVHLIGDTQSRSKCMMVRLP